MDLDSPLLFLETPQFGRHLHWKHNREFTPLAASFLEHRVCYHSLEKRGGKLVWEKNQFAIRLEINCKHVEEFYFFFTTALPFLRNLLWCQTYFDNTCRTCHINKVIKQSEHLHSNSCSPARVKITGHRYSKRNIHTVFCPSPKYPQ